MSAVQGGSRRADLKPRPRLGRIRRMKKVRLLAFALGLPLALSSFAGTPSPGTSRTFEFTYTVHLKGMPAGGKSLRLWIPVPVSDAQREISDLSIQGPVRYRMSG